MWWLNSSQAEDKENGHGQPMRDIGQMVIAPGDDGQWSTRDKQLGTTGRRMGDPEYNDYAMIRGVVTPRSLAHDHLTLLTKKERAAWDLAHGLAQQSPIGEATLLATHIPESIHSMPGKGIAQIGVNTGTGNNVYEPRWVMRLDDGEILGGSMKVAAPKPQRKTQDVHMHHGTVVHHHHHAPEHRVYGQPAQQRVVTQERQLVAAAFQRIR